MLYVTTFDSTYSYCFDRRQSNCYRLTYSVSKWWKSFIMLYFWIVFLFPCAVQCHADLVWNQFLVDDFFSLLCVAFTYRCISLLLGTYHFHKSCCFVITNFGNGNTWMLCSIGNVAVTSATIRASFPLWHPIRCHHLQTMKMLAFPPPPSFSVSRKCW
jgi:hypothetical protein